MVAVTVLFEWLQRDLFESLQSMSSLNVYRDRDV